MQEYNSKSVCGTKLDQVYDELDVHGYGCVSLVDIRKALSHMSRSNQDHLINSARQHGYSLSSAEGRLSAEEQEALIVEHGERLLYISRKS